MAHVFQKAPMKPDPLQEQRRTADREKRSVALSSVLAAVLLTGMKIVVGISTGSLGILSEAAHSGLDLVAAVVTLFAVRASSRPADGEHTYGHGKIENLSALFETVLLLVTCVWIIHEGIQRLMFKEVAVEATVWAFLTVGVSIVVDYSRSRALMRAARKHGSQALEADALHFSTDIWSSTVVLVGLLFVRLAQWTHTPWLVRADAVAALGVAGIVIWISIRLGRKTINDLLDAVPAALRAQVIQAALVPGVLEVRQARVRKAGPEIFADLTLSVDRRTSLERAHDIATGAEAAVRALLPRADVVVHVDPVQGAGEGVLSSVRLLAARQGLGVHGIRVHDVHGQHSLEMHLEASDTLTVGEAHEKAVEFEAALHEALPWIESVVTHIEPVGDGSAMYPATPAEEERVVQFLQGVSEQTGIAFRPHEVRVRRIGSSLTVSFHCVLEAGVALTDAHSLTEDLERRLRAHLPELERVVVHVEPPADPGEPQESGSRLPIGGA